MTWAWQVAGVARRSQLFDSHSLPLHIMALETAHDLSISDLLCVLNEKLGLDCTRIRDIFTSREVPATSLELEVSNVSRSSF